ncbi:MAG TPA: chorismate-binding protein [Kineosporiaceae bacterium]
MARFDDLVAGHAWGFAEASELLTASRLEDVPGVLQEVEQATTAGAWAFGMVAYEAAPALDAALFARRAIPGLPLVWFGVGQAPVRVPLLAAHAGRAYDVGRWTPDWDGVRHGEAVARVRDMINDGETYQCNLTTRLRAPAGGDLDQMYADLALAQRGAYNAYLDLGRFAVLSASPELFFETIGSRIVMRPMKGTMARGRTGAEDDEQVRRLLSSPKEWAENVMIVDLVRNDLARVARAGSVSVPALCTVERFETLHQLTSQVEAELRPEVRLLDIFRGLFPCGSVTGAPKARTMRLIAELEDAPRGPYCGAIGMVAPPGAPVRARFSVAIRTILVDRASNEAVYGSGGGITWDSDAGSEYAELLVKARILDALGKPLRPAGAALVG